MKTVKTCIINGFGINADYELREAFRLAGSSAELLHINDLVKTPELIHDYHILAFPGGFSFGDHLGSGLVFAHLFKKHLKEQIDRFIDNKKLIIGVCNGFQVLVKMGLLPYTKQQWKPEVSLIHNESGIFQDSWVKLGFNQDSPCVWTKGLDEMDCPIRHGEGRFYVDDTEILQSLHNNSLIAVQYRGVNPNGSIDQIAGICDESGQIFGLMPHPEAFLFRENHPLWQRDSHIRAEGRKIFENAVKYMQGTIDNKV